MNSEIREEPGHCAYCGDDVIVCRLYVGGSPAPMLPVVCDKCQAEDVASGAAPRRPNDVQDWLHALGVNTRKHGEATLENFDATFAPKALAAAQRFVAHTIAAGKHDRVAGLYLVHESKGTGKSHLAVAIMRAVHQAKPGTSVAYVPADRLISRVQDSYGTGTTDQLIERLRLAHLLVLDDLGREKGTDDALRTLCTVLDEREGAPTVITANGTPAELAGRFRDVGLWDRVASRLGDGVYRYVRVSGPDRRFLQSESGGA